ncbi:MAG: RNA-binding S4 domain-containing protein [Gammaproteobacteria bacterium]
MEELIRIDKWLWAARFHKTRNLAAHAVDGGRVHVNGKRIKPSYRVKIGDVVLVTRPDSKQEVLVTALSSQRRSASEAQELYQEGEDSIAQRELATAQRKILNQGLPRSFKKPNKHERQKIRAMLGKSK